MTTENIEPNRRRGRARTTGSETKLPEQRPFKQPRMKYAPTKVLSDDEIESIHLASLRILSDYGMDFLDADARNLLQKAGAKITDNRVRFDPEMVLETIKTCPSEFKLHSRNPDHTLNIGGDWMAFGSVGSTPNFIGFDGVRHPGTRKDYQDLLKLTQVFNVIHFLGGYPVEPIDLHASIRHIETSFDALTMTDKVLHCYSLGRQRNQDVLEMTRIARQVSHETLENEPSVFSVINSSSPLRLDTPMLQGIMEFSSRNQLIVMTPFTLAGAMAPITLAGALSQQNAEALAGMTFTQLVRPGAPVAYGGFTSNVCAANALDAQAAYESVFSLWGAIQGGVNFLMHGAGWMEGGLHSSLEKFVLDADLLGMVSAYLDPIVVDEATLAYEAIGEVGPGGHYFGVQHTQDRFRDAFHKPMISDWRNYESWQEGGSPTAVTKTTELAHKWLDSYETPTIDAAALEELQEFRARRLAEGGVATDY